MSQRDLLFGMTKMLRECKPICLMIVLAKETSAMVTVSHHSLILQPLLPYLNSLSSVAFTFSLVDTQHPSLPSHKSHLWVQRLVRPPRKYSYLPQPTLFRLH